MNIKTNISISANINAPIKKVWEYFTYAAYIKQWNNASDDWHTPHAENDLKVGGKFLYRMEAKDGSMGFDFWGVYDEVKENEWIAYTLGDGRKVSIHFSGDDNYTRIEETFEAEQENPVELQRTGWQCILDNFKRLVESMGEKKNEPVMEVLKFVIHIQAPREKVWEKLWEDSNYRKWTAVFCEGSYAESDWKEGSRILFLSPGGNGMYGIIETMVPLSKMVFKHMGEVKNGKEEPKAWQGAMESYLLSEMDGTTTLTVELDTVAGEMQTYFKEVFPKAMDVLKKISEQE